MKLFFPIFWLLLVHYSGAFSQTVKLDWAKQITGNSFDVGHALTVDEEGNIYTTGYFSGTADFDPGPGIYNLTSIAAEDIFVSKSDSRGNLIWAKSIGDFRYQAGYAIALDAAANIYVTGIFFGTVDFDPGAGESKLVSSGNEDVFICKLDNNGNFKWAKSFGGSTNDFSNGIILDNNGNIYLNGYFDGTSDFDPDGGIFNMTSFGATDIYVCKFNNSGNLIWAKQMGGPASESAYAIGLDDQNNVYSTGFFWGTSDFDPGPAVFNLQATGFGDGFILKLNTNGQYINSGRMGGNNLVRCTSLKVDKQSNLYVTGYFDGEDDFDPGPAVSLLSCPIGEEDIFIAKYNSNFQLVWVKQIGGPSFQKGFAIETDETGNVYATGNFQGTADFDPGPGLYNLTANGIPDIFVLKLTNDGNFIWVAQMDGVFYESGYSIKVDKANEILITGTFDGTTDFDPGAEVFTLTSAGQSEIFMQKLKQCANPVITNMLSVNSCTSYTLNNKTYTESGNYQQSILNKTGCDSILINLNLTITRIATNVTVTICQGELWKAGGKFQKLPGLYYDTLKTNTGCDSVVITNLAVNPLPKPNLGVNRNICQGETVVLYPGVFTTYLWQNLSTQPVFNTNTPGIYKVAVTNEFNCSSTAQVVLNKVVPKPSSFLPADQFLCTGNVLKIKVDGFKDYLWSTGSKNNNLEIRQPGNYYLTVTSFDFCTGTDTIKIAELDCAAVNIPNAFTPNGDGKNDYFKPALNVEFNDYQMQIFNRLGQRIFQTKTIDQSWDGAFKMQPQPAGSYVYQVTFRNNAGKLFTYKGTITLIR